MMTDLEIPGSFGNWLKERRKALDLTQDKLAQSSEAAELVSEMLQRFAISRSFAPPANGSTCTANGCMNCTVWLCRPPNLQTNWKSTARRNCSCNAEFELTEAERPALVRICQLVEGIPLAIELAAAWVGMLTCGEIGREIEANMDFLSASMRGIPERHRSLRATFDHSWRLLSDAERDTLSRLSVFHGGFDRAAAEKVAGASLPLLASLVSKSLVRRTEGGRYDLHEVVRQYAYSHLEEDESCCHQTCDRHCEHYLNFAAAYEPKLKSASQQTAMREMTAELDNLRAAWAWGIECKKFESLGRAIRAFGWYYEVSGMIRDGIKYYSFAGQMVAMDDPSTGSGQAGLKFAI
jgi:hypothetical protein